MKRDYLLNKLAQRGRLTLGHQPFAIMADQLSAGDWSTPDDPAELTTSRVLSKQFSDRYLIHYLQPSRHPLLRGHNYSCFLLEFHRQYYRNFPPHVRVRDGVKRMPAVLGGLNARYRRAARRALATHAPDMFEALTRIRRHA